MGVVGEPTPTDDLSGSPDAASTLLTIHQSRRATVPYGTLVCSLKSLSFN